jgi:hypothetical protein
MPGPPGPGPIAGGGPPGPPGPPGPRCAGGGPLGPGPTPGKPPCPTGTGPLRSETSAIIVFIMPTPAESPWGEAPSSAPQPRQNL